MAEPARSDAIFQQAIAFYRTGDFIAAQSACEHILARHPNHAPTLNLAGAIAVARGDAQRGIALFKRACKANSAAGEFHYNLGAALAGVGDFPAAIEALRQAVRLDPTRAAAWNNLASAQQATGDWASAIQSADRAVALHADFADAHFNLANGLRAAGRRDDAIESYRRASQLNPADADIAGNFAVALAEEDQPDEAIAILRAALVAHPQRADLWNNLGNALKDIARLDESIAAYRRALVIAPTPRVQSNLIYAMHYHRASTPADIRTELEIFYRNFAARLAPAGSPSPSPCTQGEGRGGGSFLAASNNQNPRLRIGYLCSEFRSHVLGRFILPLVVHHDRARFEIFCYADSTADDETTKLFRRFAEHWIPLAGQSDAQIAEKIASDRLDILFDLQLHMARNRLLVFARKPAPIQATYCGYPGSTGLPTVDFRITDPVLDPPGLIDPSGAIGQSGALHLPNAPAEPTVETAIRLPHAYWCYDPDAVGYISPTQSLWRDLPVNDLPALKSGYLTFGCLNNFGKIDCQMLALWAAAMHAAPGSRLVMMAPPGSARQWVAATLESHGIAAERISFVGRQTRIDYFRTYHAIDVALDTLPANGHTTSLDALWMGVPVITRVGETAMGRATWSQLLQLGLTALAADSDSQFAGTAGQLAADLPALALLRSQLRDRMRASPLTDSRQFTRDFEQLCRRMHQQAPIRGEP